MASTGIGPTGERRHYAADQIFFSTTDKRGVIVTVNSTFVALSRYGKDQLVSAPHSVIRHPRMPSGLFHIMWERLRAGKSMMGYIENLAKDGADYLTFSTVAPLSEGFISVRSAVTRPDLWDPVSRAYAQTRTLENQWRRDGVSKVDTASWGAQDLAARFAALGFPTYDDVMRTLGPAEVDQRRRLAPVQPPHTMPGEMLHEVVRAIGAVDRELDRLRARYEDATALAAALHTAHAEFTATVTGLESAAAATADATASVASEAPAAANTAQAALRLAVSTRDDPEPARPAPRGRACHRARPASQPRAIGPP